MQTTINVIIGIGIPGCGKTTYLKPLASQRGMQYVNLDDIRQELTGDAGDHSQHSRSIALFYERIAAALIRGGVVVDVTSAKQRDRRELLRFCRTHGATLITGIWFDVPLATCIVRNSSRTRQVPTPVLEKMHGWLIATPPTQAEGFDDLQIRRD